MKDYFEHERNMEHPMYKKGFQYVFDHYGVPRLPHEKYKDTLEMLHKSLKLIEENRLLMLKLEEENENLVKTLKATRSGWYYQTSVTKKLRKQIKAVKLKWYLKPFNKIIWDIKIKNN